MTSADRAPGLVLAATPLGDVRDASQHLRELIADADVIAAEDTRRFRALARRLSVSPKGRVVSLHDHNERSQSAALVREAADGVVLVVSDAGQPLISDPGHVLVRDALAAGVAVRCAPGPSAVTCALALSGLPAESFAFDGFVPRAPADRAKWLDRLAGERRTVVAFDSPKRLAATLHDAVSRLGSERAAAVARELTKPHEEVVRGTLGSLAREFAAREAAGELKGEVTVLIGGASESAPAAPTADLAAQVDRLTAAGGRLKDAVDLVAGANAVSRRALYQAVLEARADPGA